MCDHFLNRINCPASLRKINGCNRGSILDFSGICECGSFDISDTRIAELLIDVSLQRRYDLLAYNGYSTLTTVNLCDAYAEVCEKMMDHIQCPSDAR